MINYYTHDESLNGLSVCCSADLWHTNSKIICSFCMQVTNFVCIECKKTKEKCKYAKRKENTKDVQYTQL